MRTIETIARGIVMSAALFCICALLVWFVIPYIILGWDLLFPHYNHNVAVLSSDIECQASFGDSECHSIVLPKGLMIYAPCRHDFGRMSHEENCIYKIYLKLDSKTVKTIFKDSDVSFEDEISNIRKLGELEEKREHTFTTGQTRIDCNTIEK